MPNFDYDAETGGDEGLSSFDSLSIAFKKRLMATPIHAPRGLLLFSLFSVAGVSARLLASVLAPTQTTSWWTSNPTLLPNMFGSAVAGLLKGRMVGKALLDDSATGERK